MCIRDRYKSSTMIPANQTTLKTAMTICIGLTLAASVACGKELLIPLMACTCMKPISCGTYSNAPVPCNALELTGPRRLKTELKETGQTRRIRTADHNTYEKTLGAFLKNSRRMSMMPMATYDAVMLMFKTAIKTFCNVFIGLPSQ